MNDIETYIQTRPDSALTVLSQIDTSSLHNPKERAQFALLYAIALDKNYIDTIDIGVIRPAAEYYSKHGTARQKMLTYYMKDVFISMRIGMQKPSFVRCILWIMP